VWWPPPAPLTSYIRCSIAGGRISRWSWIALIPDQCSRRSGAIVAFPEVAAAHRYERVAA